MKVEPGAPVTLMKQPLQPAGMVQLALPLMTERMPLALAAQYERIQLAGHVVEFEAAAQQGVLPEGGRALRRDARPHRQRLRRGDRAVQLGDQHGLRIVGRNRARALRMSNQAKDSANSPDIASRWMRRRIAPSTLC